MGTLLLLPPQVGGSMVNQFLENQDFLTMYQFFTAQGFQFIPERAKVSIYVVPPDPEAAPEPPAVLMILPSFRTFQPTDPSHEAVSIVALSQCERIGGVTAAGVVVGHNPYQLLQMSFFDISHEATVPIITKHSASRTEIQNMSVQELAALLGPLPPPPSNAQPAPVMELPSMRSLTATVFKNLLTDAFAAPLYPPGGISSLLNDTQLVQKWTEVQRARFPTGSVGLTVCTSTSSNACSSTSSSVTIEF